jgi:hypothetical protein
MIVAAAVRNISQRDSGGREGGRGKAQEGKGGCITGGGDRSGWRWSGGGGGGVVGRRMWSWW